MMMAGPSSSMASSNCCLHAGTPTISKTSFANWMICADCLRQSDIEFSQEQFNCLFSCPVGHRHRFKIDRRLINRIISPRSINLPSPRLWMLGPVLDDHGIVFWPEILGYAAVPCAFACGGHG